MQALGAIATIASTAGQIGSSIYGAQEQKKAQKDYAKQQAVAAKKQEQLFQQYAYRNKQALATSQAREQAQLAQTRDLQLDALRKQMASQGYGPGSGALAKAEAEIMGNYINALAGTGTKYAELETSPMWPYPHGATSSLTAPTLQSSASAGMATGISDMLSKAAGYMNTMYGGNTGGGVYSDAGLNPYMIYNYGQ